MPCLGLRTFAPALRERLREEIDAIAFRAPEVDHQLMPCSEADLEDAGGNLSAFADQGQVAVAHVTIIDRREARV